MSDPQQIQTTPISVKKAYKEGCVSISMKLSVRGYGYDHAKIEGSTNLTTAQARALAQELTALADREDGKVAEKAEKKRRRAAWMDREVAAGRMVRVTEAEFFNGR